MKFHLARKWKSWVQSQGSTPKSRSLGKNLPLSQQGPHFLLPPHLSQAGCLFCPQYVPDCQWLGDPSYWRQRGSEEFGESSQYCLIRGLSFR